MVENSGISWTSHTFNPWIGCTAVGPGCDSCYAEVLGRKLGQEWGQHAARKRTRPGNWDKPITWNYKAGKRGRRERVFVASLADVFDNHPSILPEWRADLARLITRCTHLDWLLLSKRAGNVERYLREMFPHGVPPNVIPGITTVTQLEIDRDTPKLAAAKAVLGIGRAYLSMEPLIEKVVLGSAIEAIDWIIVGGESGDAPRIMHPDWVLAIKEECEKSGTSFHFKQWGEYVHPFHPAFTAGQPEALLEQARRSPPRIEPASGNLFTRLGVDAAGRLLCGATWDGLPPEIAA